MKVKPKSVYVSGALRGARDLARVRTLYEGFAEACAEAGWRAYLPHEHTDPETAGALSARAVVERDIRELQRADAVIVYLGEPSLGAGAEAAIALYAGKNVLAVWERGANVSRFVEGLVECHDCTARYAFGSPQDAHEWICRQLVDIADRDARDVISFRRDRQAGADRGILTQFPLLRDSRTSIRLLWDCKKAVAALVAAIKAATGCLASSRRR